ncbi:DUF2721 domain-containing protein [Belnapia sp. T18]|uniref:DUF2721 domain-containing protein n=1 Tax=Belnapia arida TaxID=2804533 RepID=A0ABS1UBU8_9PROT|nr:DUF2721 domain-containing protein [Belnapia arida]MBL6081990.1 DUF2721 domain-containing protein [Belnapia arida]
MVGPFAGAPLDSIAHVIQVALTPVFLLSGIGTLVSVINARSTHVSDQAGHAAALLLAEPDGASAALMRAHLARLRRRRFGLDAALALGGVGGAASCGAASALFVGAVRDASAATTLFVLFGLALACTVGALGALIADAGLAWHGLRTEGALPHTPVTSPHR